MLTGDPETDRILWMLFGVCLVFLVPFSVRAWRRRRRPSWWRGDFAATRDDVERDRALWLRLLGWRRHQYE